MEGSESTISRVGRTVWTIWGYLTGTVGRYLRPEVTNEETHNVHFKQDDTVSIAKMEKQFKGKEEDNERRASDGPQYPGVNVRSAAVQWEKDKRKHTSSKGIDDRSQPEKDHENEAQKSATEQKDAPDSIDADVKNGERAFPGGEEAGLKVERSESKRDAIEKRVGLEEIVNEAIESEFPPGPNQDLIPEVGRNIEKGEKELEGRLENIGTRERGKFLTRESSSPSYPTGSNENGEDEEEEGVQTRETDGTVKNEGEDGVNGKRIQTVQEPGGEKDEEESAERDGNGGGFLADVYGRKEEKKGGIFTRENDEAAEEPITRESAVPGLNILAEDEEEGGEKVESGDGRENDESEKGAIQVIGRGLTAIDQNIERTGNVPDHCGQKEEEGAERRNDGNGKETFKLVERGHDPDLEGNVYIPKEEKEVEGEDETMRRENDETEIDFDVDAEEGRKSEEERVDTSSRGNVETGKEARKREDADRSDGEMTREQGRGHKGVEAASADGIMERRTGENEEEEAYLRFERGREENVERSKDLNEPIRSPLADEPDRSVERSEQQRKSEGEEGEMWEKGNNETEEDLLKTTGEGIPWRGDEMAEGDFDVSRNGNTLEEENEEEEEEEENEGVEENEDQEENEGVEENEDQEEEEEEENEDQEEEEKEGLETVERENDDSREKRGLPAEEGGTNLGTDERMNSEDEEEYVNGGGADGADGADQEAGELAPDMQVDIMDKSMVEESDHVETTRADDSRLVDEAHREGNAGSSEGLELEVGTLESGTLLQEKEVGNEEAKREAVGKETEGPENIGGVEQKVSLSKIEVKNPQPERTGRGNAEGCSSKRLDDDDPSAVMPKSARDQSVDDTDVVPRPEKVTGCRPETIEPRAEVAAVAVKRSAAVEETSLRDQPMDTVQEIPTPCLHVQQTPLVEESGEEQTSESGLAEPVRDIRALPIEQVVSVDETQRSPSQNLGSPGAPGDASEKCRSDFPDASAHGLQADFSLGVAETDADRERSDFPKVPDGTGEDETKHDGTSDSECGKETTGTTDVEGAVGSTDAESVEKMELDFPQCEESKEIKGVDDGKSFVDSKEDVEERGTSRLKRAFDEIAQGNDMEKTFVLTDLPSQASSLDFTVQKSKIAVKNPLVRPPKDPRSLISMPSVEPSTPPLPLPRHSQIGVPKKSHDEGAIGAIGFKLPGLGPAFPGLRKTEVGSKIRDGDVSGSEASRVPGPKIHTKSNPDDELKQEMPPPKPKWTPPKLPGMGSPLMMAELKSKLKKPE